MCNSANETMEHIITCGMARPLWLQVHALLEEMGEPLLRDPNRAGILATIITNTNTKGRPASNTARAIWRITLRQHYAAIVRVETDETKYDWQTVYLHALHSIRTVATDYGERLRTKIEKSRLTSNPLTITKKITRKVAPLLHLKEKGHYIINENIQKDTARITAAIHLKQRKSSRKNTTNVVCALPPLPHPPTTG